MRCVLNYCTGICLVSTPHELRKYFFVFARTLKILNTSVRSVIFETIDTELERSKEIPMFASKYMQHNNGENRKLLRVVLLKSNSAHNSVLTSKSTNSNQDFCGELQALCFLSESFAYQCIVYGISI